MTFNFSFTTLVEKLREVTGLELPILNGNRVIITVGDGETRRTLFRINILDLNTDKGELIVSYEEMLEICREINERI